MKFIKKFCTIFLLIAICFCFVSCSNAKQKAGKNLTDIYLDVVLDDELNTLSVKQKTNFLNASENTINKVLFNVFANVYSSNSSTPPVSQNMQAIAYENGVSYGNIIINSLSINGKNCGQKYLQNNTILQVDLEKELYPNQRVEICAEYEIKLANIKHRLGYSENVYNLAHFYLVPCPIQKDGSFFYEKYTTYGDPFAFDCANYFVNFSAPDGYVFASTGSVQKGGQIKAITARDFCIVASKNFKKLSKKFKNTTINYFYIDDQNASENFNLAQDCFKFFSQNFGDIYLDELDVVIAPLCFGGMEYSGVSTISSSIDSSKQVFKEILVHEIAHQWWFGCVGNNQILNAWQDEGLTEFSTEFYFAKLEKSNNSLRKEFGQKLETLIAFEDLYSSVYGSCNLAINRSLSEFKTDNEYSQITYNKASLMFFNIYEIMGEKNFLKAINKYLKTNAFKVAMPENLIACFQNYSKNNIENLFSLWLSGQINLCEV